MSKLKFLVTCTKDDLWMTKLCISSIRYYYPNNEIYIIKDNLIGEFSISELIKYWNIKELTYQSDKFGISAAKMFFYFDDKTDDDYFLVLDSDIILLGKLDFKNFDFDVAFSVEYENNPRRKTIKDLYFDIDVIEKYGYNYPGYFFNAGQLVCKRGFLYKWKSQISEYFDFNQIPRWIKLDILPKHDQSLINYLIPKLESNDELKTGKFNFMIWTGWEASNKFSLDEITKNGVPYLLHYAGAFRNKHLKKMVRPDILYFFRKFYYSRIPNGKIINIVLNIHYLFLFYFILFFKSINKFIK